MARKGQEKRIKGQSSRIQAEIIGVVEVIVGKIQLRAFQALTSATPVATGFARAAWTPSTGSAVSERLEAPRTEKEAKSKASAMRAKNNARAKEIAAKYKIRLGPAFISNNVPYMEFLNRGSSAQAGAKFVERAVEAAVRSFDGGGVKTKVL